MRNKITILGLNKQALKEVFVCWAIIFGALIYIGLCLYLVVKLEQHVIGFIGILLPIIIGTSTEFYKQSNAFKKPRRRSK